MLKKMIALADALDKKGLQQYADEVDRIVRMVLFAGLDEFTQQYVKTALWSSTDDKDQPLDKNYKEQDFAEETMQKMKSDCEQFKTQNSKILTLNQMGQAGHDFWLTRNRHGAGFMDGHWPKDIATQLSNSAKKFGEVDIYVGDDGKLHI